MAWGCHKPHTSFSLYFAIATAYQAKLDLNASYNTFIFKAIHKKFISN